MYSFNPLKLPSVKVIKDDIIEKKQIIDDGIPVVVTTKKKKIKPGERLVRQYNRSKRDKREDRSSEDFSDLINKISNEFKL